MVNDKMVNSFMKRHYIIPATNAQPVCQFCAICKVSIKNNAEGLHAGGGSDGSDPNATPF